MTLQGPVGLHRTDNGYCCAFQVGLRLSPWHRKAGVEAGLSYQWKRAAFCSGKPPKGLATPTFGECSGGTGL